MMILIYKAFLTIGYEIEDFNVNDPNIKERGVLSYKQ